MYHGWSDPWLSPLSTVAYYDAVVQAAGGQQRADEFVRLFMVPGMHHCGGGPGPNTFDMLTALETWVERGVAPTRILASHVTDGVADRTRPLCPHPQVARYMGTGSIDAAENFRCEVPPSDSAQPR
jgi:feruloyl esterase